MLYCKKCKLLTERNPCHECGFRKVRAPFVDDEVYLATLMSDYEIEQMLRENDIPFIQKSHGCSGSFFIPKPPFVYYVPFGAFNIAKELLGLVEERLGK